MKYPTKTDRVRWFPRRWNFCLGINLVALTILPVSNLVKPARLLAQTTKTDVVVNSNAASAALEPKILSEINRVRTDPQGYARWLEEQRQYYDGIWLRLPGEKPIRTNRGQKALQEAIAILKEQQPLPPLEISEQTAAAATSELENFATAENIQFFSYGRTTAKGIVMGLVVDELFPDRRRRQSLLSPEAENTGVVCKPDPRYAKVCAIAYSDSMATNNVAVAEPETPADSVSEPVADPAEPEDVPEVTVNPDSAEPENVPEVTVNPDPAEPEDVPEVTVNPDPPKLEEPPTTLTPPLDNSSTTPAELPQPPQPQAPPSSTPETEDLARAEAEIDEVQQSEIDESVESDNVEENVEEDLVENEPVDSEEEAVEVEDSEEDSERVAVNSDSRLFEQIERGALESGDRTIPEDGSFYDFYPIEGKKGESYTISLESEEFDAFVALVDSNGNTIKENDDISEENSNSQIQVTLPEDGTYNVIVNTYDEEGTGQYVLTVTQ